ncbi:pyridoxal phosphate-dependent aminotransferase [Cryomorpha ignava]|uniref:Aminotransferase n=1 Tax=Cryomorpha ignava TaxID=101383 RepID=A0A7K3WP86_9FLAO|nr:pyridoxal phosphate-dependent aminotransferase [Cryomorpha ignava]NEN23348.1 pyridoxal phosphate-dependent aminotransferase [Cryomorpha ignava]
MENNVSELLNRLSESATLAMSRKSRELQEKGVNVVNLSLGEPDFNTPIFVKQAAKQAVDDNYSYYMPVNGYADFRESIAKKFKRDNNLSFTADQIVVSTGAKQSIINVLLSVLNPGDEVLLPAPYWVSYVEMVKMTGATPIVIPSSIDNDYKVSAVDLEKHITDKTRILMYSSPCNPSGSVFSETELRAIAKVVEANPKLIVISDEIYEHINYTKNHFSIGSIDAIKEQVVTVNGVSKAYAMTGYRIGFMGAPLWIAKACTKLQGQFTSGASSISQRAAKAAIEANPDDVSYMREKFEERRALVGKMLNEIDGVEINKPQGAFYMFPKVSSFFGKSFGDTTINNSDDLAEYILAEGHVATVSGAAFGSPECLRISYAASEENLIEAGKRLKSALNKLK